MKQFQDGFHRWHEDILLREAHAHRTNSIFEFQTWLRDEAEKYDDVAHDLDITDDERSVAWNHAMTCYIMLEQLRKTALPSRDDPLPMK